ncbi:hypothetical protein [Paludibacterium sp.]|uniref:hypothetical protein n=1 Tax=Paludibacterium sp. TaxID=1917523 RepID=UPI0025F7721B|nr:hypothetical protein [Paludibacterium sp.]MBV8646342.1 hypothetical protein [Paludibacterium sp.]
MAQMACAACSRLFTVRPQTPAQTYCPDLECQRERRRLWNRHKMQEDPDYRANQQAAQQAWHARNPDYWRIYRRRHKNPALAGRTPGVRATSDASSCGVNVESGLCWMEIRSPGPDGRPMAWRVELTLKPLHRPRK